MTVTLASTFIPVHDPDAALGFYRDGLGLQVLNDVASDGFRWVTVGVPRAKSNDPPGIERRDKEQHVH